MSKEAQVQPTHGDVERLEGRVRELESSLATLSAMHPLAEALPTVEVLTLRELAILRLIATGDDNSDIALSMHFGLGTIKLHVREILEKLHVTTRTAAAVQGVRRGLI